MNLTHRAYADEAGDFTNISRFISKNYARIRTHSTWYIGRFVDWRYGLWGSKLSAPDFWSSNAELWFDGFGRLAGFAISENGDTCFSIITTEGYRFLFEELLCWVRDHWVVRTPAMSIEITSHQGAEMRLLERHGFAREASFFTSHIDLEGPLRQSAPLNGGYTFVAMQSPADYRNQLILRNDAFGWVKDMPEDELEVRLRMLHHAHLSPIYHADTDLCVAAPDGSFIAGCEAHIDVHNREADIERVCTHSQFRRRGFARAVILECLVRLQAMGMKKAHITGSSDEAIRLYGSFDPSSGTEHYIYKPPTSSARRSGLRPDSNPDNSLHMPTARQRT